MNRLRIRGYFFTFKRYLRILINYPITVLKTGLRFCSESEHKRTIISKYKIDKLPTIDLLDLFPDFHGELNIYSFLEGTSLITDLLLLKSLAGRFKDCSYLEIGSFRGESVANVADVTADCTCITLSAEEMRAIKCPEDFIRSTGIFIKNKNITTIYHDSHTYDFKLLNKKFDLIFIDGDHSYEGVLKDTKSVFNLRKNEQSFIVWHDYGWSMEDVRFSVLNGILDGIPKEKHKNLFHVSNTMCGIYIEGNTLNTDFSPVISFPNKNFKIELKAERL